MEPVGIVATIILICIAYLVGRASADRNGATFPKPATEANEERIPMTAARLFQLIFLSGWLIAWSFGVLTALGHLLSGQAGSASLFLLGWLIAALAGWVWAAWTIFRLATGRPVGSENGKLF